MTSDLQAYNDLVKKNSSERINCLVWNDGVENNALIMTGMFENAREINMFCGEGSIFRKEFYTKVSGEDDRNKDIMDSLHAAIKSFIAKGITRLNVILENGNNFVNNIYEGLVESLKKDNVHFYTLNKGIIPEYHFSVGDNCMYRREIGRKEHKAVANFNDVDITGIFKAQFLMLAYFSDTLKIE